MNVGSKGASSLAVADPSVFTPTRELLWSEFANGCATALQIGASAREITSENSGVNALAEIGGLSGGAGSSGGAGTDAGTGSGATAVTRAYIIQHKQRYQELSNQIHKHNQELNASI